MRKIIVIAMREFLATVKTKAFIISLVLIISFNRAFTINRFSYAINHPPQQSHRQG